MLLIILYELYVIFGFSAYQYIPSIDRPRAATLSHNVGSEVQSRGPPHQ